MGKYEIIFKYPTRGRFNLFKKTLSKYKNMLSNDHSYRFIISMDNNDRNMNNDNVKSFLENQDNLDFYYNNSRTKVEAVNSNMSLDYDWNILVLVSDDMIPQVNGYDNIICNSMKKYFPRLDGALHFNDGRVGRKLLTLSIMGKKLYDYFGYIYHPDYISLWCDNEFFKVVTKKKKVKYIDKVIISHEWTKHTGKDKLHVRNESFYKRDRKVYLMRQRRGFPKHSVVR
ncbi:MAG: hypothetical protein ACOC56_03750 [Atribacterota bacterium]